MVSPNGRPAEGIWNYDPVELIADGVVHAIGVSLAVVGAIAIVVVAANSQHNTELPSVVVYSLGLLSMFGFSATPNIVFKLKKARPLSRVMPLRAAWPLLP